jgi:predicted nuclease of predicted toxin-antitoxin system
VKLLLDENLPARLVRVLADAFPGSEHVKGVGLEASPDSEVWSYAREHGFALVSKDSDFQQMSFLLGFPPKVVWVRVGNCSVDEIEALLLRSVDVLLGFDADDEAAVLILS